MTEEEFMRYVNDTEADRRPGQVYLREVVRVQDAYLSEVLSGGDFSAALDRLASGGYPRVAALLRESVVLWQSP